MNKLLAVALEQLRQLAEALPSETALYTAEHMERYGHGIAAAKLRSYAELLANVEETSSCS